jgi:TRAP-type C4-dicarboxylate transport system substrate-binding protein
MKFKKIISGAFGALALTFGASQVSVAQDYPKMNLRMAHAFPAGWAQTKVDQWWADQIRERSGGNIRITIMWAGAGGKPLEILRLVQTGAVDLGAVPPSYFPDDLPLSGAPNSLPLTFKTNEEASNVMEGLVKDVAAIQDELKKNNIWPLFFHTLNTYQPLCTKPISNLAEFNGMRIRSFGAYQPSLWSSLGAVGVNVLPAELYEGLQRGRLDCGFFSTDLYASTKLYEVAKFLTSIGFGPQPTWPIWVNYKKWETEYPDNVKKLFMEVSKEARLKSLKEVVEAREGSLKMMMDNGVTVVEFTDEGAMIKQAPDFKQVWLEAMKAKGIGPQAQSVLDYWNKNSIK